MEVEEILKKKISILANIYVNFVVKKPIDEPARAGLFRQRPANRVILSCHFVSGLFAVLLMWNPNPERDLAGYRVYLGERSRHYYEVYSVGLQTAFTLQNLKSGKTYFMAVTAYDLYGNESRYSEEALLTIPADSSLTELPRAKIETSLSLVYNFPNPFNADHEVTSLRYFLTKPQEVTIRIFDVKGDLVHQPVFRVLKNAGEHLEDQWDGANRYGEKVAAGLYFCEISTADQTMMFRIAVLRR